MLNMSDITYSFSKVNKLEKNTLFTIKGLCCPKIEFPQEKTNKYETTFKNFGKITRHYKTSNMHHIIFEFLIMKKINFHIYFLNWTECVVFQKINI